MTERGIFDERKNVMEEGYFHKKEQELISQLRGRAARESERLEMGATLGTTDADILVTLQELGYTRATVSVLHLVPLVQVAWAEGNVSKNEREMILEAARARGVEAGSEAHEHLTGWLNERPSEEFFERTLSVIGALLRMLPSEQSEIGKRDLVSYCTKVAEVSGGLIGFVRRSSRVCKEERELLARIAADLDGSRSATVQL